jgi:Transposase domain (DUF772)
MGCLKRRPRRDKRSFGLRHADCPSLARDDFSSGWMRFWLRSVSLKKCTDFAERLIARADGRPGIDPVVYFKMLMVGFFENLPSRNIQFTGWLRSERAIAARCQDSFAVRAFLGYGLEEATPDHSSLSVIRLGYAEPRLRRFPRRYADTPICHLSFVICHRVEGLPRRPSSHRASRTNGRPRSRYINATSRPAPK